MHKTLGLLLLLFIPMLYGIRQYRRLDDRVRFWSELLRFLHYAQTAVRYLSVPTAEIFARCPHETAGEWVRQCAARCTAEQNMPEAWRETVAAEGERLRLSGEEQAFLRCFGEGFGTSDAAGQQAHFAYYTAQTAERLRKAETEKKQNGRLWLMLGAMGGIGLDILLI